MVTKADGLGWAAERGLRIGGVVKDGVTEVQGDRMSTGWSSGCLE